MYVCMYMTLGKVSLRNTKSGGWRAVYAAVLQGKGSRKRNVFVTDTGRT